MNYYDEMTNSIYERNLVRKYNRKKKGIAALSVGLAAVLTVGVAVLLPETTSSATKLLSARTVYAEGEVSFESKTLKAYRNFCGDTFARIEREGNTLYSPMPLFLGLSILASGAAGETKAELLSLLHMDEETLVSFCNLLCEYFHLSETVKVAGSLWIRDGFSVQESFLKQNADFFGGEIYQSDFSKRTVNDINVWVRKATNGQIREIIDKIDPSEVIELLTSLSMEARWSEEFSSYADGTFTANGETKSVQTLKRTLSAYYDSGNALAFTHSLLGKEGLTFMGILPNDENYVLDAAELSALFAGKVEEYATEEGIYSYKVYTTLPKFQYESELTLQDMLESLGVKKAFSEGEADFSGIAEGLFLHSPVQHAAIDLNKNGIKASAVVRFPGATEAAPPIYLGEVYITLDRPFYYLIYAQPDWRSEDDVIPLFMGYVTNPR
ncbi:MAG: hypothetical protein J6D37_06455 [Clostridia bacterium]|nr:hypothetical protein [Clostridia bacterium]